MNTKTNDISRLLEDLNGPDGEARATALKRLIGLGAPIRDVLASGAVGEWDCPYSPGEVAKLLEEETLTDRQLVGLLGAITGRGSHVRFLAIDVNGQNVRAFAAAALGHIKLLPTCVIDGLTSALCDEDNIVRRAAAKALGEIGSAEIIIQKGLAKALSDSDFSVVLEAIDAIVNVGVASEAIINGLTSLLNKINHSSCEWAMSAVKSLHAFDVSTVETIRRIAVSNFVIDQLPPELVDDEDYWNQCREDARERHARNKKYARELLVAIPIEAFTQEHLPTSACVITEEDKRILEWFSTLDLKEYRTILQVFWCIGQIDRDAIQTCGPATGAKTMSRMLKARRPTFGSVPLSWASTYVRHNCIGGVDSIFYREPFRSQALLREERALFLRETFMNGKREEKRWTPKARKAWHYIDRFLRIKNLLPTMTWATKEG